jgi:hypothetical protein
MIAPLEKEDMEEQVRFEIYSGIIGSVAASAFFAHKKTAVKSIRLADILKDYSKVRAKVKAANKVKDTRFDLLTSPIDELIHTLGEKPNTLNEKSVENLKQFFLDIPLELLSKACKKFGTMTFSHKDDLLNDPEFVSKLTNRE